MASRLPADKPLPELMLVGLMSKSQTAESNRNWNHYIALICDRSVWFQDWVADLYSVFLHKWNRHTFEKLQIASLKLINILAHCIG